MQVLTLFPHNCRSVSNPILSALQEVGRSISQLHENGPTRRYSTPATTTLPYIPAPDYEDASGSIPIGNGNARKGMIIMILKLQVFV